MKLRITALLLALVFALGILASCATTDSVASPSADVSADVSGTPGGAGTSPTPGGDSQTPVVPQTPEPPRTEDYPYTDSAGRSVVIPANLTKVSPSGALAEIFLMAIAPDLLVSIPTGKSDAQLKYLPANVKDLTAVGQFYGSGDLNIETVAAIGTQLIIDVGEPKASIVEDMDDITATSGVPAVHITGYLYPKNGEQNVADAYRELGKILNREARAEQLAQYIEKILAQTDGVLAQVGDNKVKTLYLLGDLGTNVLGNGSFHAEVIDKLTDNVAVLEKVAGSGAGNESDIEQITAWNPDFIIFAPSSYFSGAASDPAWAGVTAITGGKYIETPQYPYNWMGSPPSVQRVLGLILLPAVLYPQYATYDVYDEVREYYALFYGYDLSQADFDALTANSFTK
ncbi:MAG: ABC transporter substrate-binding protein [Oscillospiraceae bacterium]|jgi:iron complex transport system substrate-binding protein|nr:ABC transporter substrate-binding protein [Oscillospiraceae bacterium]